MTTAIVGFVRLPTAAKNLDIAAHFIIGAYKVQMEYYGMEPIQDKNQVHELTLLSPRVARRLKTPVGKVVRRRRSRIYDATLMNQEPNIDHGI